MATAATAASSLAAPTVFGMCFPLLTVYVVVVVTFTHSRDTQIQRNERRVMEKLKTTKRILAAENRRTYEPNPFSVYMRALVLVRIVFFFYFSELP